MVNIDVIVPVAMKPADLYEMGIPSPAPSFTAVNTKHCLKTFQLRFRYKGARLDTHQSMVESVKVV